MLNEKGVAMHKNGRSGMNCLVIVVLIAFLTGCAGKISMPASARAGDTITLGAGWKKTFDRGNVTVTITGADSSVVTYLPGNPAVRAIMNLYPDPLSYLVVGTRMGLGTDYYRQGVSYGSSINSFFTGNDPDWWQTSIYLDLPSSLPVGTANVRFQSTGGETYGPVPVQIIAGQGSPSLFTAEILGPMTPMHLQTMERMESYAVNFTGGSTVAAAIQVDLTHTPDFSAGGLGRAFAVNPRGEMKNLTWTDNGTHMRVLLLTSGDGSSKDVYYSSGTYGWKYFKFYVTGGVNSVAVTSVKAYDIVGNPIAGVMATVD